jgi:hypothetical protein
LLDLNFAGGDYFAALAISLLRGRTFSLLCRATA